MERSRAKSWNKFPRRRSWRKDISKLIYRSVRQQEPRTDGELVYKQIIKRNLADERMR